MGVPFFAHSFAGPDGFCDAWGGSKKKREKMGSHHAAKLKSRDLTFWYDSWLSMLGLHQDLS
jgi:hypothetical protein